jgi:hypothetical protein
MSKKEFHQVLIEIQQKINSNQKRTKAYQRDLEELKNQAVEFGCR